MSFSRNVIIIGGHVQGLGICRILGKMGYQIVLFDDTRYNLTRWSKFCKKFVFFREKELLSILLEQKDTYKGNIIFPTSDKYAYILSKHKIKLSENYIVATADFEPFSKCYNKRNTYNIAENLNIPYPKTWMPKDLNDLSNLKLEYPIIIKPAVMHSFFDKIKKKVFVCNNSEELLKNYEIALTVIPKEEIIIQEIIMGSSDNLFSACFLYVQKFNYISFVGKRARQHPPDFGNATTFAIMSNNDRHIKIMTEQSLKFLREIDYNGVCEVEFKYDQIRKEFLLLEINPRTWKWHSITEAAEIPLLPSYVELLLGHNPLCNSSYNKSACFRHLITDLPTIFRYKLKGIYQSYPSLGTQHAVWSREDILPAVFELFYLPILILKR